MSEQNDNRVPESLLSQSQLKLFHRILTRFESSVKPMAVKDFRSKEVSELMRKYQGKRCRKKLYLDEPIDSDLELRLSELRFNHNNSKVYELISNLRHAFAHNRISLDPNDNNILCIENSYNKKIKMLGKVRFDVLKELMETILGDHNLSEKEKRNLKKRNKKGK